MVAHMSLRKKKNLTLEIAGEKRTPSNLGIFVFGNTPISWVVPLPRLLVTTRIVSCLVGNPYKPSFATITGKGDNPTYITEIAMKQENTLLNTGQRYTVCNIVQHSSPVTLPNKCANNQVQLFSSPLN